MYSQNKETNRNLWDSVWFLNDVTYIDLFSKEILYWNRREPGKDNTSIGIIAWESLFVLILRAPI